MTDINTSDGAILEALNNKADLDLNNANPGTTFKSQSAGWAMPSNNYLYTSFVKTAIGTYTWTAPANGYFIIVGTCGVSAGSAVDLYCNDRTVDRVSSVGHGFGLSWHYKKGDAIKLTVLVTALTSIKEQVFYYAQGEI